MRGLAILLVLALAAGCIGPASDAPSEPSSNAASPGAVSSSAPAGAAKPSASSGPSGSGTSSSAPPSSGSSATSSQGPGAPPATGNSTASNNATREPVPFEPTEPSGSCGSLDSFTPVAPNPLLVGGLALGWPLLEVTAAVLADPAFVAAHPDDWEPLLLDLVADSSALFEDQIGVRLNVTILDRLPDGSLAPGSGDGRQRAVGRGYMQANHPEGADIVAVILGADYEGTTAGQVECVHGAGFPDYSYLWAEYTDTRGCLDVLVAGALCDTPLKVFTHETGHLFAAHHHYSNCGEGVAYSGTTDATGVCDIMINDIGLASQRFGPTNRWVMRSYVEEIGIGEPA